MAECPKELGSGLVLSTADGAMSMTYRPFLPGLISEERVDDRPDMPDNARRVSRIAAQGIIGVDSQGPTGYVRVFLSADPAGLARLNETGTWETGLTTLAGPVDRSDSTGVTGRQVVRFVEEATRSIGACSYRVWVIEHERTIHRPGRPDAVQRFRQWWSPELGVALGLTDAAGEDFGPEVPFARIAALD